LSDQESTKPEVNPEDKIKYQERRVIQSINQSNESI